MRPAYGACLALLLGGCAVREPSITPIETVRVALGDSALWSRPDYDDASWREASVWSLAHPGSVLWLRAPVPLTGDGPFAISVAALASHELWWDGVPIGRGGTVGRVAKDEIPGPIEADEVDRHTMVLALRCAALDRELEPFGIELGDGALERRERIVGNFEAHDARKLAREPRHLAFLPARAGVGSDFREPCDDAGAVRAEQRDHERLGARSLCHDYDSYASIGGQLQMRLRSP